MRTRFSQALDFLLLEVEVVMPGAEAWKSCEGDLSTCGTIASPIANSRQDTVYCTHAFLLYSLPPPLILLVLSSSSLTTQPRTPLPISPADSTRIAQASPPDATSAWRVENPQETPPLHVAHVVHGHRKSGPPLR